MFAPLWCQSQAGRQEEEEEDEANYLTIIE